MVFGKADLHGLYDKLGITKDAIQRGKMPASIPITPPYSRQREKLQQGIDESYQDFVGKVANARHRASGEIEPVAQGRVWLGSQAKRMAL